MKSKVHLFLGIITFLAIFSTLVSAQYYLDYTNGDTSDSYYTGYTNQTLIPDWYDVSDEEVAFCQNYGGQITGEDVYITAEGGYAQPVSKLTVSLQGYSTILAETTLYEIAWYVQPLSEDVTYTVYLIDESGNTEEVFTGYATAIDGDAGYETIETAAVYESLRIVMEDGATAVTVPFVEKEV